MTPPIASSDCVLEGTFPPGSLETPSPAAKTAPRRRAQTQTGTTQIRLSRLWLGVGTAAAMFYAIAILVMSTMTAETGFTQFMGGELLAVSASSPAGQAGFRAGDVVVSINGAAIADAHARAEAVKHIQPGERVTMSVQRAGGVFTASFVAERSVPFKAGAAVAVAILLLGIALLADRGGPSGYPRTFFRSCVIYVILAAGSFSLPVVVQTLWLQIPFLFSVCLAAPATCHFMLKFPAGPRELSFSTLFWIYAPPLAVAVVMSINQIAFSTGTNLLPSSELGLYIGAAAGISAAIYLTIGAVSRVRRIRAKRDEIDPVAVKWLSIGALFVAGPFLVGLVWAVLDKASFVGGGFATLIAATMVGGNCCLVFAMTRCRFGQLDSVWRRSSGYVLATGMAAAAYLALIGLLGGTATALSGGDFRAALAATLAAAVVFGPLRIRVQRVVDQRFGRDRRRARRMLREAAEAATATLSITALQGGVVHRVRAALSAAGAGIYDHDPQTDCWHRRSLAGDLVLPAVISAEDPVAAAMASAIEARALREVIDETLAIPLPVQDRAAVLVVQSEQGRRFDDEERDLLSTAAAGLVVAIGNARAHTELVDMAAALKREVEVAEQRRREIARLKDRVEEENRALIGQLATRTGRTPVIGGGLEHTFELVQKVARTDTSVLVHGETGVGKELVSRAIHIGSARREKPFIVVDCGAISPNLFESTLFGHVRGAFTGAIRDAQGAFRAANGGTIFLDEIGELPLELQPKLLRVLQEREVRPVGSDESFKVDVRVVAGTNRDLSAEVASGGFRQDLLYRLQVVEIEVPPLRKRRCDIEALAEHFLALHAERHGRAAKILAPDARQALLDHDWPGNVRELEHALEAAAVYAEGEEIRAQDLPIFDDVFRKKGLRAITENERQQIHPAEGGAPRAGLKSTLDDLEKTRISDALDENSGNKTRTAKALGMSRGALLRRIKRYGIAA